MRTRGGIVEMPKTKKGSAMRKRANVLASDLTDRLAPTVEGARDKAAPVLADARDRATPAYEGARDRFTSDVLPVLTAAAVAASEATEEVRGEIKKRGRATVAALRGELEAPKKTHRFRNFLVVLGLGGIAAAVAKKLSDRPATTTWESTPTPTPSPAGSPAAEAATHRAPVAPVADASSAGDVDDLGTDYGGASPDVAAADAAAEPHPATTPDDPATTVDVSDK
ncbi:MAG: hypothetical protein H0V42_04520 [Nocardioidaceae bacterium]|nr:hypothetical protein [Nocardioidaceae bacterium]